MKDGKRKRLAYTYANRFWR